MMATSTTGTIRLTIPTRFVQFPAFFGINHTEGRTLLFHQKTFEGGETLPLFIKIKSYKNKMVNLEDLFQAYYDCRKSKRRTSNSILFELNYETKLVNLCNEINNHEYDSNQNICFVVTKPKPREIFAADFKDRIVHHYIFNKMNQQLERWLIPNVFNCRKNKGTLYGLNALNADIKTCSENYTKDCWIAKFDLQGFFMSIDKNVLISIIEWFIRKTVPADEQNDLIYLCRKTVFFKPQEKCYKKSPDSMWKLIPPHKSLFTVNEDKGLPIGNLSSQMFANLYLSFLDNYITKTLGFKFYGRYVDDFYIIDTDKEKILKAVPLIREYLDTNLKIKLHPQKFYCQHYSKGVAFTGGIIKPYRTTLSNRTLASYSKSLDKLCKCKSVQEIEDILPSVNSYLGALGNFRCFKTKVYELTKLRDTYFWEVGFIQRKKNTDKISLQLRPQYRECCRLKELVKAENAKIREKKARKQNKHTKPQQPFSLPKDYVLDIDRIGQPNYLYPDDYEFDIDKLYKHEELYPSYYIFDIDKPIPTKPILDIDKFEFNYNRFLEQKKAYMERKQQEPKLPEGYVLQIDQTSVTKKYKLETDYTLPIDLPIINIRKMKRTTVEEILLLKNKEVPELVPY